jgi:lambda family phage portal protein
MTPIILPSGGASGLPLEQNATGGGLEGAERASNATANWLPQMGSPDRIINSSKELADARGQDMVQNDGYAAGAANLHKDNIVGAQYRLNARPNWRMLGVDEAWAEAFQVFVENRFNTIGDAESCWFDAAGRLTFTGMVRLAVGGFVITGEVLATVEWMSDRPRPFKTALQMVSPSRLSNPNGAMDTAEWRRGVQRNAYGRPINYAIRTIHPGDMFWAIENPYEWKVVPAEKSWGRKQVIHIVDQLLPDQTRGVADMVAALKQMRMTKNFQEIVLQNAVINASYAAAIESELPSLDVFAQIGGGTDGGYTKALNDYMGNYLGGLGAYLGGAGNITIDGAMIPHLYPGTKLNFKPVGTPGGVGSGYEASLQRNIAAALGVSYEQFSRDYSQTNYSSARASGNETWKFMQGRKKGVADRFANNFYALWLEEQIALGQIPLPAGKTRSWFYEPYVKEALCEATWIGASRGQVDETKETQAAIMRIEGGLSTYEKECARLGDDFREIFAQRAREEKLMATYGLKFGTASRLAQEDPQSSNQDTQTTGAQDAAARQQKGPAQ